MLPARVFLRRLQRMNYHAFFSNGEVCRHLPPFPFHVATPVLNLVSWGRWRLLPPTSSSRGGKAALSPRAVEFLSKVSLYRGREIGGGQKRRCRLGCETEG